MNVIVTIAALDPAHGGPARTVPALCRVLGSNGVGVTLFTISEGRQNLTKLGGEGFHLEVLQTRTDRYHSFSWRTAFARALERRLRSNEPTVVYDVGLWLPSNHFVAKTAHRTDIPLVVSPRGMLSTRALQVAKWKKKLAWEFYQKRDMQVACVLHATSEAEAADFRGKGLRQPIAVIPNGIDVPESPGERQPKVNGLRTALFLSRLHPIKGLRDLVQAWARVQPCDWQMVIAGPDENGHRAEIEALLLRHNLKHHFKFVGAVNDEEKWSLYRSAELFILPSHSESFGQVIGEALATGLPVITTRATPWNGIETRNCGWWVNTGVEPLTSALRQAVECSSAELQQMGERGRQLIVECFSWKATAERMMDLFSWLVGDASEPNWLI